MKEFLIAMVILGLGLVFGYYSIKGHDKEIKTWANKNKYTIVSSKSTILDYGPFYYCDDHQYIYKVIIDTKDKQRKTFYFRFGSVFGTEIEEYNK